METQAVQSAMVADASQLSGRLVLRGVALHADVSQQNAFPILVNTASVIGGAVVLQRDVFEDLLIDRQYRDRAAVTGLVGVKG